MSPVGEHHAPVMVWSWGTEGVWTSVPQEHKGRVEVIHGEFRKKEHKGLGMQEGWKHYTPRVQEGGSTAPGGCREDGMQSLGLEQQHSGQGMFSAWHRHLAAAGPGHQPQPVPCRGQPPSGKYSRSVGTCGTRAAWPFPALRGS